MGFVLLILLLSHRLQFLPVLPAVNHVISVGSRVQGAGVLSVLPPPQAFNSMFALQRAYVSMFVSARRGRQLLHLLLPEKQEILVWVLRVRGFGVPLTAV